MQINAPQVFPGRIEDYAVNTDPQVSSLHFSGQQEQQGMDVLQAEDELDYNMEYSPWEDLYEEQVVQQQDQQEVLQQEEQAVTQAMQQQHAEQQQQQQDLMSALSGLLAANEQELQTDLFSVMDPSAWISDEPSAVDTALQHLDTVSLKS